MKILLWLLRLVVFIALFGLSIKNSGTVDLRFFFNQFFTAPLSLTLLAAFALGVVLGLTALFATFVAQRREIQRLRRGAGGTATRSN